MANVVEIQVVTRDRTKPGFESAKSGAGEFKGAILGLATAAGAALVGMTVKSLEMGAGFESAMTRLVTQAHVAQGQLPILEKGVLDLAGKVGFDPESLAEALYHVESNFSSMGISSAKALELTKVAAEGARVGGADLVDVTNALTAAVASGIPGVNDFTKAMGFLNATVGAGDMTMQNLAQAMASGLLAVVKGYGLSIRDVGAALATFGDNNIRGANAATALRMAVQSLAVPAKDGQSQLKEWGITAGNLGEDMQKGGLLKALEHLQQLFKDNGITATQQGDVITQMFGKKAGVGLAVLMGQMDRLKSKYPELDKGANDFGDAWKTTTETLKQRWDNMVNWMKARMTEFGLWMIKQGDKMIPAWDKAMPTLKKYWDDTYKTIKGVFDKLGPIFKNVWKEIQKDTKDLVKTFKDNWPEIKILIQGAAIALGLVIGAVLQLIDWFIKLTSVVIWVDARIVDAMVWLAKVIVDAAANAFGWIPGLGPQLKKAQKAVDDFAAKTLHALNSIPNKTITVTIAQKFTASGPVAGYTLTDASQWGHGLEHGGVVGQAAAGTMSSGMTWVGEHGPELLHLPAGARVFSNPDSRHMAAETGGGGRLETDIRFGGAIDTVFATMFMRLLRQGQITISQRWVTT